VVVEETRPRKTLRFCRCEEEPRGTVHNAHAEEKEEPQKEAQLVVCLRVQEPQW
jgi:hypothetical protein